ncbi:MAG TPA: hypothetical protein VE053_01715 [Allosphingosinicella sp.]|nr:hypothetical protein [Allosphingosinicella sp.]
MKLMAIAAAAVLASGTVQAETPSSGRIFCAELRRVLDVAALDGDFTYLERSRAAPPRLGFRDGCQATGDGKRHYWACSQNLSPEATSRDALAARVTGCLPEAVRAKPGLTRDAVFTLPHARIHISEIGGPGAKVGRIVQLTVEAIPAP